jgi:SAM-dependent methyltransferase/uncharacterized protein YbaR (Trm112 family)
MTTVELAEPFGRSRAQERTALLVDPSLLRCPESGQRLLVKGAALVTVDRARSYEVIDGVPILLGREKSLFSGDVDVVTSSSRGRVRETVRRRLTASPVSARNAAHLVDLLGQGWSPGDRKRLVLIVGGGILGFGLEALTEAPWIELVESDVYIGPRTRVVCDGHDLPFADGTFDAVVCQAVLEHVADPVRVVGELHRVLVPKGLAYSEVPFMQQVHEGAYDFTRWTLTGHRRLLRGFDEIDCGAVGGPGEALTWSLRAFALSVAPNSALLRRVIATSALCLGVVLRGLDRFVGSRPAAVDGASGTYLLARRRSAPRSDTEIVDAYTGPIGRPLRCG